MTKLVPYDIAFLADTAERIRALGRHVITDVIEIGRLLTECKARCGHGNWLPWLEREFGWTDKTAERFMSVSRLAGKSDKLSNLELPVSSLYMLAAPSTSESAREEVITRAESGERLKHAPRSRRSSISMARARFCARPRCCVRASRLTKNSGATSMNVSLL